VFLAYSIGMLAVLYSPYSLIISTGKTRLTFYLSLVASATNLGMSWAGITLFGMIGAAVGSTSCRFLVQVLFARIAAGAMGTTFRRLLPWGHLGRTLLIAAAAGVPAGGVLFLPLPPVARLLAGTALYFGAYVLIGLKTRLIEDSHLRLIRHWLAGPRRG
jgi:O-antigen/teichoic acid export membrane protein